MADIKVRVGQKNAIRLHPHYLVRQQELLVN